MDVHFDLQVIFDTDKCMNTDKYIKLHADIVTSETLVINCIQ